MQPPFLIQRLLEAARERKEARQQRKVSVNSWERDEFYGFMKIFLGIVIFSLLLTWITSS